MHYALCVMTKTPDSFISLINLTPLGNEVDTRKCKVDKDTDKRSSKFWVWQYKLLI